MLREKSALDCGPRSSEQRAGSSELRFLLPAALPPRGGAGRGVPGRPWGSGSAGSAAAGAGSDAGAPPP